jgi:hypothetical protein
MGFLAKSIGIGVKELDAWDKAGLRVGGQAGDVASEMKGFSADVQHFLVTSDSAAIPVLRQLQNMAGAALTLTDATGKATPPMEFFLALSDRFSKMSLPEVLAKGSLLPGMNETTIRLLHEGREAVNKYLADARRLGVISEQDAEAAQKFNQAMENLKQPIFDVGRAIFLDLAPGIEKALKAMSDWIVANRGWIEQGIGSHFTRMGEILGKFPEMFKTGRIVRLRLRLILRVRFSLR